MANVNKLKKYHFLYKTTNLLNEKFYIGIHSTNNLNDGYLGSGRRLKHSIKKYGVENFKLEILEFFNSREMLVQKEKDLVNEHLLKDANCLNLRPGGSGGGGFTLQQTINGGKYSGRLQKHKLENDPVYREHFIESKRKIGNERFKLLKGEYPLVKHREDWTGKKHSIETIEKMRQSRKSWGLGITNSQYGTCWITNGIENKKIPKFEEISTGWVLGRKIK